MGLGTTYWKQPTCTEGVDANGQQTRTVNFKGKRSDLATYKSTLVKGSTEVETGWVASLWNLSDGPGETAILSITCSPKEDQTEEQDPERMALRVVWKCRSVRNDISILAFCGPSEGNDPHRTHIELWQKETDATLADADKYHANDTDIETLTQNDLRIVNKIRKGVESVMRFYPVLTCVATYSDCPPKMLENLSYIDTPSAPPATETDAPGNLAAVINAHQWVRCQDDVDETADGKWTRTISWMGILKSDDAGSSPWDPDLYGPNRWKVPS